MNHVVVENRQLPFISHLAFRYILPECDVCDSDDVVVDL